MPVSIATLPCTMVPLPVIAISIPIIPIIAAIVAAIVEVTPVVVGPETVSIPVSVPPALIKTRGDDHRSRRISIRIGGIHGCRNDNARRRNLLGCNASRRYRNSAIVGVTGREASRQQEYSDGERSRNNNGKSG